MRTRFLPALAAAILAFAPLMACAEVEEAPEDMQGTVKVGDQFPEFALNDQDGAEHTLASLLEQDGVLALVFYRSANW